MIEHCVCLDVDVNQKQPILAGLLSESSSGLSLFSPKRMSYEVFQSYNKKHFLFPFSNLYVPASRDAALQKLFDRAAGKQHVEASADSICGAYDRSYRLPCTVYDFIGQLYGLGAYICVPITQTTFFHDKNIRPTHAAPVYMPIPFNQLHFSKSRDLVYLVYMVGKTPYTEVVARRTGGDIFWNKYPVYFPDSNCLRNFPMLINYSYAIQESSLGVEQLEFSASNVCSSKGVIRLIDFNLLPGVLHSTPYNMYLGSFVGAAYSRWLGLGIARQALDVLWYIYSRVSGTILDTPLHTVGINNTSFTMIRICPVHSLYWYPSMLSYLDSYSVLDLRSDTEVCLLSMLRQVCPPLLHAYENLLEMGCMEASMLKGEIDGIQTQVISAESAIEYVYAVSAKMLRIGICAVTEQNTSILRKLKAYYDCILKEMFMIELQLFRDRTSWVALYTDIPATLGTSLMQFTITREK